MDLSFRVWFTWFCTGLEMGSRFCYRDVKKFRLDIINSSPGPKDHYQSVEGALRVHGVDVAVVQSRHDERLRLQYVLLKVVKFPNEKWVHVFVLRSVFRLGDCHRVKKQVVSYPKVLQFVTVDRTGFDMTFHSHSSFAGRTSPFLPFIKNFTGVRNLCCHFNVKSLEVLICLWERVWSLSTNLSGTLILREGESGVQDGPVVW